MAVKCCHLYSAFAQGANTGLTSAAISTKSPVIAALPPPSVGSLWPLPHPSKRHVMPLSLIVSVRARRTGKLHRSPFLLSHDQVELLRVDSDILTRVATCCRSGEGCLLSAKRIVDSFWQS